MTPEQTETARRLVRAGIVTPHRLTDYPGIRWIPDSEVLAVPDLAGDSADWGTGGVLLTMLAEAWPRRLEVHVGGEVGNVRIRSHGIHRSDARPRLAGWSVVGSSLGEAAALGLFEVWGNRGS